MKTNVLVTFTGCSDAQRNWGSYTGDDSQLVIGKQYRIISKEVHSQHTRVTLDSIKGTFNSVCFEPTDKPQQERT